MVEKKQRIHLAWWASVTCFSIFSPSSRKIISCYLSERSKATNAVHGIGVIVWAHYHSLPSTNEERINLPSK